MTHQQHGSPAPPLVIAVGCGLVHLSVFVLPVVVPLAGWLLGRRYSPRLRRHAAGAFDFQVTFLVVLAASTWGLHFAQSGVGSSGLEGVLTPIVVLLLIAGVVLPLVNAVQGFTGDQQPARSGLPLLSRTSRTSERQPAPLPGDERARSDRRTRT